MKATIIKEDNARYYNIMHELVKLPFDLQIAIRDWLIYNSTLSEYEEKEEESNSSQDTTPSI